MINQTPDSTGCKLQALPVCQGSERVKKNPGGVFLSNRRRGVTDICYAVA